MSSNISVRNAHPDDVGIVCSFVRYLADYENLAAEVDIAESSFCDSLFRCLNEPRPKVMVAESLLDHRIIGFSLFIRILSSTFHLEDLFVSQDSRKTGAGIALLSTLASYAVSKGAHTLEWACLDWNQPSLDFYASLGALPIADRVILRISGSSLFKQRLSLEPKHTVRYAETIPDEFDKSLKCIQAIDAAGNVKAALYFTLSFSSFKATSVILVTSVVFEHMSGFVTSLVDFLISLALDRGYKRVEFRIHPVREKDFANALLTQYGAIEMKGWIPFALTGDNLRSLANRKKNRSLHAEEI